MRTDTHRSRTQIWSIAPPAAALTLLAFLLAAPTGAIADGPRRGSSDVEEIVRDLVEAAQEVEEDEDEGGPIEFDEAEIFFEENATDGDLGIQFFFDGEGWKQVSIRSPHGRNVVNIKVKGDTKIIGLTEIFSESAEPSFDEMPRDEFLALFPPGEYTFKGKTIDGVKMIGVATLTHDMPAQPVVLAPMEDDVHDAASDLIIMWESVPDPDPPFSVIEAYQLVVEKDEDEERLRVLNVDLPADATSMRIPAEFFEAGKAYKMEIIAIETSNNKTITEVPFETSD